MISLSLSQNVAGTRTISIGYWISLLRHLNSLVEKQKLLAYSWSKKNPHHWYDIYSGREKPGEPIYLIGHLLIHLLIHSLFTEHPLYARHYGDMSSLVAQMVKCLPAMWETQVRSLGQEDPLEKGMAIHSSMLAWKIPWTEDPGSYSPWGCKESDMTEWMNTFAPVKQWSAQSKHCKC